MNPTRVPELPLPPIGVKFDVMKESETGTFHIWISKPGTGLYAYRKGPDRIKALRDALEDFYVLDPSSRPIG